MIGDFHTHTHLSDGSMEAEDLVEYAKQRGIKYLGITDHDTLLTKEEAIKLSDSEITVIGGAEFSCIDTDTGRKVHILCFLPDDEDKLLAHCEQVQKDRDIAGLKMVEKVSKLYPITLESVISHKGISKSVFKQHIMHSIIERGYTLDFYGTIYKDLFGKNGSCYEKVPYPTVEEMISLIKECGGVCILAHPKVYNSIELAHRLAKEGKIDGIEVYHHSASEQIREELLGICKQYDLIVTGGSDFHGLYSANPRTVGFCTTEESEIKKILSKKGL